MTPIEIIFIVTITTIVIMWLAAMAVIIIEDR